MRVADSKLSVVVDATLVRPPTPTNQQKLNMHAQSMHVPSDHSGTIAKAALVSALMSIGTYVCCSDNLVPDVQYWRSRHKQKLSTLSLVQAATQAEHVKCCSNVRRLVQIRNNRLTFPIWEHQTQLNQQQNAMQQQQQLQVRTDTPCNECDPQLEATVQGLRKAMSPKYNISMPGNSSLSLVLRRSDTLGSAQINTDIHVEAHRQNSMHMCYCVVPLQVEPRVQGLLKDPHLKLPPQ